MHQILTYAIPVFIVLMVLEHLWTRRLKVRGYETRDTVASLAMGVGNVIISLTRAGVAAALMLFLYEHRLWTVDSSLGGWALTLLAEDFAYYWFHRASHESRFLWAAHVNHHSSQRYNLSTALRQSWTTPFTTLLFYWPLPLLGFHPAMILTATSLSLIYQFWIHTECIDRLGWFEKFFNTPSHHRVHHGANTEYLDRNHGGILIIWDRLFGTFEPEVAPVRYGLTKNIDTYHPLRIAFHEWAALLRDMRQARSWRDAASFFFAPPGWRPEDGSMTSRALRANARRDAMTVSAH